MTTKVYDRVKGKWVVVNDVTTELTDISPIDSQHILGRNSAGNGPVESLAKTEVKSILGYLETEQDFADLIQAQSNIVSDYGSWLVPVVNGIYRTVDYITTSNLKNYVLTGLTTSDVSGLQTALNNKLDASAYVQHYRGKYTTLSALTTAIPTATIGDYAQVDTGIGVDVVNYNWDSDEGWVIGSSGSGATDTDMLTEGSTNLYFTATRVRTTTLTGLSLATSQAIATTDTVLQALGYLQVQTTGKIDKSTIEANNAVTIHNITTTVTVPFKTITPVDKKLTAWRLDSLNGLSGSITIEVYKNGSLILTTAISANTFATGIISPEIALLQNDIITYHITSVTTITAVTLTTYSYRT